MRDPGTTTYLARFDNAEDFGLQLRQEARIRGLGKAQRSVFIGDGAHWLWNLARINFPNTIIGKRAKQSGMFWKVPGAQHVLDIRCAVLGETYDAFWRHRRQSELKSLNLAA